MANLLYKSAPRNLVGNEILSKCAISWHKNAPIIYFNLLLLIGIKTLSQIEKYTCQPTKNVEDSFNII